MAGRTRGGTVAANGLRLAYRETLPIGPTGPTGPTGATDAVPVIALHGLASGAGTWDRFATELAGHDRRTIALDARGHGDSDRPGDYGFVPMRDDVLAVLDTLGLWKVDLVGHSMGGHVATLVAMHAPHRIRRLLLEDTPPPPPDDLGVPAVRGFGLFRFGSFMLLTRSKQFDLRMSASVIPELRTPDPLWWQRLAELKVPTLVIRGGPGSHVPGDQIARVAQTLPDSRMITVEQAKHRVHSQYPDEFARIAIPFITAPGPRY